MSIHCLLHIHYTNEISYESRTVQWYEIWHWFNFLYLLRWILIEYYIQSFVVDYCIFFFLLFQMIKHYIYDISNIIFIYTQCTHIILCVVLLFAYGYIMSSVRSGVHISTKISINSDYNTQTSYVRVSLWLAYDRDRKYFLWKCQNNFSKMAFTHIHIIQIYTHNFIGHWTTIHTHYMAPFSKLTSPCPKIRWKFFFRFSVEKSKNIYHKWKLMILGILLFRKLAFYFNYDI